MVAIYLSTGALLVQYEYDAWGNCLAVNNANGDPIENSAHIGHINPIRYRGYYYDSDLGLYYLQSRYYNPEIGRFINADSQLNQQDGVLGFNMYAYCLNNPVKNSDPDGHDSYGNTYSRNDDAALGLLGALFVVVAWLATYTTRTAALPWSSYSSRTETKTENDEKRKDITVPKSPSKKVVFPVDPEQFQPNGLIKVHRDGSKNGAIINWMDPVTNVEVFRWDENSNFANGPHYHIYGTGHYAPGTIVPEPFSTIYFSAE